MFEVREDVDHEDHSLHVAPSKIHTQSDDRYDVIHTDPHKSLKRSVSMSDLQKSTQKKKQDALGVSMKHPIDWEFCLQDTLVIPSGECIGCYDDSVKSNETNRPYRTELEDEQLDEQIRRVAQAGREHISNKGTNNYPTGEIQEGYVTPLKYNRQMTSEFEQCLLRSPLKQYNSSSSSNQVIVPFLDQDFFNEPASDSLFAVSNLKSIPNGLLQLTPKKYPTDWNNQFQTNGGRFSNYDGKLLEHSLANPRLLSELFTSSAQKQKSHIKPKPYRPYSKFCAECGQDAAYDYTIQACSHRLHQSCKRTMNNKRRYRCPLCEIKN